MQKYSQRDFKNNFQTTKEETNSFLERKQQL